MILVTGGTGFLGSEVCKQLALQGNALKVLKRATTSIPASLLPFNCIEWVNGSLLDSQFLEKIFSDITQVYHCAAAVSFEEKEEEEMLRFNVVGTKNLINACKVHNAKLLHVSSVATLEGSDGQNYTDEHHFPSQIPNTHPYGVSKYLSELAVLEATKMGLKAIIVNPSIILGYIPSYQGSGAFFKAIKEGLSFYTDGASGFVAVEDVARCMIALMEKELWGQRFLISSENITYRELCTTIALAMDKNPPKFRAGKMAMALAWRVAKVISLLLNRAPLITKETAKSSSNITLYNNTKIRNEIGIQLKPIKAYIQEIAVKYRENTT